MFRLIRSFLILLVANSFVVNASAQSYKALPQNIFEVLGTAPLSGEGAVKIYQSNKLLYLVGKVSPEYAYLLENESKAQAVQGYRILFFNSNMPKAKAMAYDRQDILRALAPEYSTYIHFNSPFWRVEFGDFKNREEAVKVLRELSRKLPNWKKEAYIVKTQIRAYN